MRSRNDSPHETGTTCPFPYLERRANARRDHPHLGEDPARERHRGQHELVVDEHLVADDAPYHPNLRKVQHRRYADGTYRSCGYALVGSLELRATVRPREYSCRRRVEDRHGPQNVGVTPVLGSAR